MERNSNRTAVDALSLITAFDALGFHRTGSAGDEETTDWLIQRLAPAGVAAAAYRFTVPILMAEAARIEVNGVAIDGHPQADAGATPAAGVRGPVVASGAVHQGALAVCDVDVDATHGEAIDVAVQQCLRAGTLGLIVVAQRSGAGPFLMNAPRVHAPVPLPILYIDPAAATPLREALQQGMEARLVIDGVRRPVVGSNVVATIAADAPHDGVGPLVAMTPKSGWFTCAAERGGGIVVWLAAAEAAAATSGRRRDVILLATSGHELGHAGLEAYLLEHPGLARDAVWLHLGASIGAAVAPPLGLFASDAAIRQEISSALDGAGAGPYRVMADGQAPGGEARNIKARGGRYASIAGMHASFHTPQDRPDKVDAASVVRYAAGITALVREMISQRGA